MEEETTGRGLASVARRRSAASEHEGKYQSRQLDEQGTGSKYGAETVGGAFTRRSGLDRNEGTREESGAEICHSISTRHRHRKLLKQPASECSRSQSAISLTQIRL